MKPNLRSHTFRPARGFSLIELMVALVIGMLTSIAIMQVFSTAEKNKRITTGGSDAQINSTLSLYTLERDVRQAGNGINSYDILGCSLTYKTKGASPVTVTLPFLAPVTINSSAVAAGDTNTDTLLIFSGTSNNPPEGDMLTANSTSTTYTITTPTWFSTGDELVAASTTPDSARPPTCALTMGQVTGGAGTATLTVSAGTAGLTSGAAAVFDLGNVYNMPVIRAYAVRSGVLTVCDYTANNCGDTTKTGDTTVWVPVAGNIVSLRAEYAHDTTLPSMDGVVDSYDQITPGTTKDTLTSVPISCDWARVLGVNVVVVARSQEYDKSKPTTSSAPNWAGAAVAPIDLTVGGTVTDWQYYRYKTIETSVPIRNLIWKGSQSGC